MRKRDNTSDRNARRTNFLYFLKASQDTLPIEIQYHVWKLCRWCAHDWCECRQFTPDCCYCADKRAFDDNDVAMHARYTDGFGSAHAHRAEHYCLPCRTAFARLHST
jgi:hypothetical protein